MFNSTSKPSTRKLATSLSLHALSSCRLDISGNVKVSDFGLAEDVYTRGYFRLKKDGSDNVRLPYKWIPPESFQDGVFSEKSDVVGDYTNSSAAFLSS